MRMLMIQLRMSHVTFACSGYVYARQVFQDLFSKSISTVGQVLSQPHPNVAKFLTWVGKLRLNHVQSDGSALGPGRTLNKVIIIGQ